ncbi:hypothetical protein PIB30_018768 [Stylosanthes scabra]|uniref:RNase H type-1 domain-containing protein n=1 Tax=Stylosanthes scabra TaxID=79078 RepID=A0ABU6Q7Y9_9FABA|nr:hypothetical protein [Stylosanthes scabra]
MEEQFIPANQQGKQQHNRQENSSTNTRRVSWRSPPSNWIKVNTDAVEGVFSRVKSNQISFNSSKKFNVRVTISNRSGFTWTSRDGNRVADLVASMAATNNLRPNWMFRPPIQVMEALRCELLRGKNLKTIACVFQLRKHPLANSTSNDKV